MPTALAASITLVVLFLVCVGSSGAEVAMQVCPPLAAPPTTGLAPLPSTPAAGSEPVPEQILVCVGSTPITGATYLHWLAVARASEGPAGKGRPTPSVTELHGEILGFLISAEWVRGEAKALHVGVSAAEVKKRFDRTRDQQFPRRREFEGFLRSSRQTVADLLFRVEVNVLSTRIMERIAAGHHSAASRERALSRFVRSFRLKWQAQTYCAAEYAVVDCGHVQAVV